MTRTRIECRAGGVGVRERARAHVCGGEVYHILSSFVISVCCTTPLLPFNIIGNQHHNSSLRLITRYTLVTFKYYFIADMRNHSYMVSWARRREGSASKVDEPDDWFTKGNYPDSVRGPPQNKQTPTQHLFTRGSR